MRELPVSAIAAAIARLCVEANMRLGADMAAAFVQAHEKERDDRGKENLAQLIENMRIAADTDTPICQDTGMAVVFLEIGQDVHLCGGDLRAAVDEGVRIGYREGYLRKSVVGDPLLRKNTGDNTPAVLHLAIVPGTQVHITVAPKGFGSENTSAVHMLKPADGVQGVKNAVLTTVRNAGPNACPPFVVGVGVGGTFEQCALLAKRALLRQVGAPSPLAHIREMEAALLSEINAMGIGPGGLGGDCTAFAVHVETAPTHIAGLPVAVNICCHVNRHASALL